MPRIFDNQSSDKKLQSALELFYPSYERIDVATGYFGLRGWSALDALVRRSFEASGGDEPVARILVGMVLPAQHQEILDALAEDMAPGTGVSTGLGANAAVVRDELKKHLRSQLSIGIPSKTDRETLQSLRELIEKKAVSIRVYTRQPLHGKTYLLHHSDPIIPSAGFVGSSNLTGAGLNSNLELNLLSTEDEATKELSEWFEQLWNDKYTLEIDKDILELIDDSWAAPAPRSPYDVYLKVCHTMSRDVRAGLEMYSISPLIDHQLLDFQKTAVKTLARRILQRRGTMLGDVVGLGKTITATAVALMLQENHGFTPLVICPKNLEDMWKDYLREYQLAGLVVPYSMAHRVLPELARYKFVIIDESHTLRNQGTRTYHAVQSYLHNNDSHVLLLTATPYNLKYEDVANQLGLFIDENEDLGLVPSAALKNDPHLYQNLEFAPSTLAAFRKSEEPDDWKRLMGEHLVRRTRSFVESSFAKTDPITGRKYLTFTDKNGVESDRFSFPSRRVIPLDHKFEKGDTAEKMVDSITLDAIANLRMPRYDLTSYLHPDAKHRAKGEDKKFIEDFTSARGHVSGFVRTNFYKRLSSCGHSFILSLQRHLRRNELFLYALRSGLPLPAGTLDPATLSDDSTDVDELKLNAQGSDYLFSSTADDYARLAEETPKGIRWVNPTLFTDELVEDLETDTEVIRELLEWFGAWNVSKDSKLAVLADLIENKHRGEKVLIFTEYKDTAKYLESGLKALGVDSVAAATGESEDATWLAKRFSPETNKGYAPEDEVTPEKELRVLIATDVLSEGQNLQQAHIIANYDLPWAIIKLIQRAGRVDRIGQKSDEVLLYTMVHGDVEEQLNLRKRIQLRLAQNAATFGSDEKFFGTDSETQAISDLYNGKLEDSDAGEDVDAGSLAYEIWNSATKDDPELKRRIERLPDMIDATRPQYPGDTEGVLCCASSESGIDSFAWQDASGNQVLLTGHEALAILKCQPETTPKPLAKDHDEIVATLIRDVILTNLNATGRLRGERRIIFNLVGDTLEAHSDPRYSKAIDALYSAPLTKLATDQLRRMRLKKTRTTVDILNLAADLHEQGLLTTTISKSAEVMRIVASMGVSK